MQKRIGNIIIPYLLDEGRTDLIEAQFRIAFGTPKKVEKLLEYTNYQMFWWTIEHEDNDLMNYILTKTTERGKFLIVCHNNYELIKKFIDLQVQKVNLGNYQSSNAHEIFKILLNANPNTSYLIVETIENYLNEKIIPENLMATNLIKSDFKDIFIKSFDTIGVDHNPFSENNFNSTAENNNSEQILIGANNNTIDAIE